MTGRTYQRTRSDRKDCKNESIIIMTSLFFRTASLILLQSNNFKLFTVGISKGCSIFVST